MGAREERAMVTVCCHIRIVPDHRIPDMMTYPLDEILLGRGVVMVVAVEEYERLSGGRTHGRA